MAKVTLVFEGENAAELQKAVCDYIGQTASVVGGIASTKEAVRPATSTKSTKKEKEVEPSPVEEETNPFDTDEEATPAFPTLTFEGVTEALKKVGEKVGVAKVREILSAVGCKKAKELEEKNFQKVMDACNKALA